jgi:hypothetical protein
MATTSAAVKCCACDLVVPRDLAEFFIGEWYCRCCLRRRLGAWVRVGGRQ